MNPVFIFPVKERTQNYALLDSSSLIPEKLALCIHILSLLHSIFYLNLSVIVSEDEATSVNRVGKSVRGNPSSAVVKQVRSLKGRSPAEISLSLFPLYRQMSPNIQLSWIKRFYRAKQKQLFGDKVQDCKD